MSLTPLMPNLPGAIATIIAALIAGDIQIRLLRIKRENDEIQRVRDEEKQTIDKIVQEREAIRSENEFLRNGMRDEIVRLQGEVRAYREDTEQLRKALQDASSDASKWKLRAEDAEGEIKALRSEVGQLRSQLEQMEARQSPSSI